MAISGKIQDAAAAALSAIEEALDLNTPETADQEASRLAETTKMPAANMTTAMSAATPSQKSADIEPAKDAANPTLNLQLPPRAKPTDKAEKEAREPLTATRAAAEASQQPTQAKASPPPAPTKAPAAGSGPSAPATNQQKSPPVAPKTQPANDDRRTIGELRQALQIEPNRAIMGLTLLSIAAWAALWTLFVFFHQADILGEDRSFLAPKPILTILALFAPIVFMFVTGVMARRAHEMRLIANAMTEVAIRLIEPETIATEQVVALSQAIRREAASMGDGIERALSRAGELEVIVRTEVTNLERSYSDNERRIRLLIDELAREREAIVVNADNARTALFGARDFYRKTCRPPRRKSPNRSAMPEIASPAPWVRRARK